MPRLASDNFNRAKCALVSPWVGSPNSVLPIIVSNHVEDQTITEDAIALYAAFPWGANQYAQVTVLAADSQAYMGACVRGESSLSGRQLYYITVNNLGGSATVEIGYVVPGTPDQYTTLASTVMAVTAGSVLRVVATGTSIAGYLDNRLVLGPITNGAIPGPGTAGVYLFINSGGTLANGQVDNWEGGILNVPRRHYAP